MRRLAFVFGLAILLIGCGDPPTPEEKATRTAARATREVEDAREQATRTAVRATRTTERAQEQATKEAREAAEEKAEQERKAREQATRETIEAEERRKGLHCLSGWDGHSGWLKREIQRGDYLQDPGSFEARETRIGALTEGEHYITMTFSAKNAFGARVAHRVRAYLDHETCRVTRIVGFD